MPDQTKKINTCSNCITCSMCIHNVAKTEIVNDIRGRRAYPETLDYRYCDLLEKPIYGSLYGDNRISNGQLPMCPL